MAIRSWKGEPQRWRDWPVRRTGSESWAPTNAA